MVGLKIFGVSSRDLYATIQIYTGKIITTVAFATKFVYDPCY